MFCRRKKDSGHKRWVNCRHLWFSCKLHKLSFTGLLRSEDIKNFHIKTDFFFNKDCCIYKYFFNSWSFIFTVKMSRKRKTIKEKFCFRKSKLFCAHKISSIETIFLYKSFCLGLIGFIQLLYFSETDPFFNGLSCSCCLYCPSTNH